jgi:ribosomal protein L7/L12
MTVNDLQCPNCGAQVDFAGETQATCSFCQSKLYVEDDGVKVHSALSDLLEGKPAPAGVDVDQIQQLLRDDKKIDAIKLVRQQTGLGLKEAKDAVEAIERGETPMLMLQASATVHDLSNVDLDQIMELLRQGKKIEAVKLVREQTGLGLKPRTLSRRSRPLVCLRCPVIQLRWRRARCIGRRMPRLPRWVVWAVSPSCYLLACARD